MLKDMVSVLNQVHVAIMTSAPWSKKMVSGRRLVKNAIFTAVFTWRRAQSWVFRGVMSVVVTG